MRCIFEQIGLNSKTNDSAQALCKSHELCFQRQSDQNLPKTKVSNGVTAGKSMTKNYSGISLSLTTAVCSSEGQETLVQHPKMNDDSLIDDWNILPEGLLQWETWL